MKMKNIIYPAMAAVTAAVMLCSCGDTSAADALIKQSEKTSSAADSGSSSGDESEIDDYLSYVPPPSTNTYSADAGLQNGEIDVDLTQLNTTMTYSMVTEMMMKPELYAGKKIRAKGAFAYTTDDSGKEYFAAMIQDVTACCSQAIEFDLNDGRKYPDDYPPLDTEITITGTFHSYQEGVYTYIELLDATMETTGGSAESETDPGE